MNIKRPLTKWVYKRGWNLKIFATLIGVKKKTLENYLSGSQKIPIEKCLRIYELTELDEFLDEYIKCLEEKKQKLIAKSLDNLSLSDRYRLIYDVAKINYELRFLYAKRGQYEKGFCLN